MKYDENDKREYLKVRYSTKAPATVDPEMS